MLALASAASGIVAGTFAGTVLGASWPAGAFALTLAAIIGGASRLSSRSSFAYAAGLLACLSLGIFRTGLIPDPSPAFASDLSHRASYEGIVVGDPDIRDTSVRVPVTVRKGRAHATVLAVLPRNAELARGDRVYVYGTLMKPEPFASDGGRTFPYDKYLAARGISYLLEYGGVRVERPAPWYSPLPALARVKHWFLQGIARGLPEPYASLAGGLVIGGKSGIGNVLEDAFAKTGLVQIVVLSGYNVMIVADWVMALAASLAVSRKKSAIIASLSIALFIGIAGASATALRAALMAMIAVYARATGKTYSAGRALLSVVCALLLWNPLLLAYDPGFGLSVAATAGLIWLSPRLAPRLAFLKRAGFIEGVATTLAAQIAVLPLLLYDTGNLSLVAIPANLLVAPLVPIAMGAAALAGLLGALAPPIAFVAGLPAYVSCAAIIAIAVRAASLPLAAFTLPAFPFALVVFAYAALVIAAAKRSSMTFQFTFFRKAST